MMYSLPSNTKVWTIEKYQRLSDIRNNPIAIEKKYMNDLLLQVNMNLKMISVVNNGGKMEEFCFSPLVYPHEVICKDMRILFTTKSQKDGSVNGKFRVRFRCLEQCQNFCSFLSNFLNILMYDDLQRRDSQNPNFSASTIQNVSSSSMMTNDPYESVYRPALSANSSQHRSLNRSFGEFSANHSFNGESAGLFDASSANDVAPFNRSFSEVTLNKPPEAPPNALNRSMAESTKSWTENKEAYVRVSKVGMEMSTQTQQTNKAVPAKPEVHPTVQVPAVNINIGSLISDAAMSKFTSMCESFFDRLFSLLETRWGSSPNSRHLEGRRPACEDEFCSGPGRRPRDNSQFQSDVAGRPAKPSKKNALRKAIEKKKVVGRPARSSQHPSTTNAKRAIAEDVVVVGLSPKRGVPKNRKPSKFYNLRGAPPLIQQSSSTIASEIENLTDEDGNPPIEEENPPMEKPPNPNVDTYFESQICWY